MKYCANCGTKVEDGAAFCQECGAAVTEVIAVQETAAAAEEIVSGEDTVTEAGEYTEPIAEPVVIEKTNGGRTEMILAIVGLALGCSAYFTVPGIIVSAIAKGKVRKAKEAGVTGGKLKAASILSKIGLALSIAMTVIVVLVLAGYVMAYNY